jgi:phosphoribosylformylglycinamidine synthase
LSATNDYKDYNGFAVSHGLNPAIGKLDPYQMALNCCDEAVRNLLCVGADITRTAFLDNFCWGSPENENLMGALVLVAKGCYDGAMAYGAPFISGKDSFYNQSKDAQGKDLAVPSTILISAAAPVYDIRKAVTMDLKEAGNDIYAVGVTKDELGGSVAAAQLGLANCHVPVVDCKTAFKNYRQIYAAMQRGLVQSAHDCSQGGLAGALAEMCFSGGLGANIDLGKLPCAGKLTDGQKLFSESASRIILEVSPKDAAAFAKIMKGAKFAKIGAVSDIKKLEIFSEIPSPLAGEGKGLSLRAKQSNPENAAIAGLFRNLAVKPLISEDIFKLKKSWQSTEVI